MQGTVPEESSGGESTRRLAELVNGASVKVTYAERDQYGRILGTVWLGGRNINLQMVSEGYAWAYHYNKDPQYNDAQNAAKARRLGLWAGAAQDPWAYRRGQKGEANRPAAFKELNRPSAFRSSAAGGVPRHAWADGRGEDHRLSGRVPDLQKVILSQGWRNQIFRPVKIADKIKR